MRLAFFFVLTTFFAVNCFAIDPLEGLPDNLKKLHQPSIDMLDCSGKTSEDSSSFSIGNSEGVTTLYIVPCYEGAYQSSYRLYLKDKFGGVLPVSLLSYDEQVKGIVGTLEIVGAIFDPESQQLTSYSKARGIGDCGQISVSKLVLGQYGFAQMKTTQIQYKSCDGQFSDEWPTIFQQN